MFVMIIDDSLIIRKILEVCLHRAGYETKSFPDAIELFRWLNTPGARIPALVLVDVCLPGKLDGYDIITRLKARPAFGRTVFVVISRFDGVIDRLKARIAGAKDYVIKPFRTQELLMVIQKHLGMLVLGEE